MKLIKIVYIVLGSLSLLIGIAGIVIPGLPTTPFLLLTAAFYIRGSDKLYDRLISNRLLGPYLLAYRENPGIPAKTKVFALLLMWAMIAFSTLLCSGTVSARILILSLGVTGTLVVVFMVPTVKRDPNFRKNKTEDRPVDSHQNLRP